MPDALLDGLAVSQPALALQLGITIGLSVLACILLCRRITNRARLIPWVIISWAVPIVGPLAVFVFLFMSRRRSKAKNLAKNP